MIKQFYLTLSAATTPDQSGLRSVGNGGVRCIPQRITGASPSDCLVSNPGQSLEGVLPLCKEAVGVFYSQRRLALGERNESNDNEGVSYPPPRSRAPELESPEFQNWSLTTRCSKLFYGLNPWKFVCIVNC